MLNIKVNKLKVYGYHGCLNEEKKIGTYFLISVKVQIDNTIEIKDNLKKTINYSIICDIVKEKNKTKYNLIETFAERIISELYEIYTEIKKIKVEIIKQNPPVDAEVKSVSIIMKK